MRTVGCSGDAAEGYATVYVNNPPRDPSGVSASVSGNRVTVTWNANPEPDITSYEIARNGMTTRVTSSSFSEQLPPGTYTYRVTAYRQGTDGQIASSAVSSNAVTVQAAPPSSDPNPSEPDDGSSDDGGTLKVGDRDEALDQKNGGGKGGGGGGAQGGTLKIRGGTLKIDGGAVETFAVGDLADLPMASLDLPFSLASLPSLPAALPPLVPEPPKKDPGGGWGVFDDTVSFASPLGTGAAIEEVVPGAVNIAARSPDRILPPDQMRWVGIGILAMGLAAIFWLLDVRLRALGTAAPSTGASGEDDSPDGAESGGESASSLRSRAPARGPQGEARPALSVDLDVRTVR